MKIVTSLYGDKYVSLLLVFLESIYQNTNINSHEVYVYWSDVDEKLIDPLKAAYSKATFFQLESVKQIDNSSSGNYFSSLKSGKMAYLNKIYDVLGDEEKFLLIDCDTIILEDLANVLDSDFDIAFTPLPASVSTYPVNIGLMFFKNSDATRRVTNNMQKHISQIVEDEQFHNESFAKYGAADQAALCRIIDFNSDKRIEDELKVNSVKQLKLDWFKYNNFSSVESLNNISVLHLKGSWQTLIFRGRSLQSIKNKGREALTVYLLYIKLFRSALQRTYSYKELDQFGSKLGVKIPFFISFKKNSVAINEWRFRFYKYPERIYRYFFNRKLSFLSNAFEKALFREPKRICKKGGY